MTPLERLIRKKEKLIVGLMSGTSVDAIDAVLVSVRGSGTDTRFRQIGFRSFAYPRGFRDYVLSVSQPGGGSVDAISALNILFARMFADAVLALTKKTGIPPGRIDLIGSHGQTIHHVPAEHKLFGKKIRSTLQIGDPSAIAKFTGIPTVGNFRVGDMALGGQGAPLVPYFDYLAFRSSTKNRAVLNIGGIANITLLKNQCREKDVLAFDTGPGNMVIDAIMARLFGLPYDRHGAVAARGKILPGLLRQLMGHRYFSRPLPKSTGREMFGDTFVKSILHLSRRERKEDIVATVTEFTAVSIADQFQRHLRPRLRGARLHELIVSGGGTKNVTLMKTLTRCFFPSAVLCSDERGVPSDAKEALCFALLANETLAGHPANIPSVTGAASGTVLGSISL